jgi:hypothetical protein
VNIVDTVDTMNIMDTVDTMNIVDTDESMNIVDTVDTMNIEIVVNIGSIVNAVKSARRRILNIVNDAKTLNSGPLYCGICVAL